MVKNVKDIKETIDSNRDYTEIDAIKSDIASLRDNIAGLTSHLKNDGKAQVRSAKETLSEKMTDYKRTGRDQINDIEERVREKPGQSVAIAFAAGLVASYLMRGR